MAFSAVAAAATVMGTATSMMTEHQQATASAGEARYRAQVASNDQQVAQQEAQDSLDQGQAEAQQQRQKAASLVGSLRANSAANGVTLDSGSALDLQSDAADQGELNAEDAINGSQQQAYGQQARAMDLAAQAGLDDAQAGFAGQQGDLAMTGSLLGGVTNLSRSWSSLYQNEPAFRSPEEP